MYIEYLQTDIHYISMSGPVQNTHVALYDTNRKQYTYVYILYILYIGRFVLLSGRSRKN